MVQRRGALMSQVSGGGMAAVIGMEPARIEEILQGTEAGRRLDVALERALGLGALSLRAMVINLGSRMGVDTRLRLGISRIWLQGLPLASGACLLLQQPDSARQLCWVVPACAGRALAQAR